MPVARPVAASLAVHAAALAAIGSLALTHRAAPASTAADPPLSLMEVTLAPSEAAGVVLLGDLGGTSDVPSVGEVGAVIASAASTHRIASTRGTASGALTTGPGRETGPGTTRGHELMKMRGPELRSVALSFDPDKHPLPPRVAISGRLQDAGRSAVIHDRVTTVTVEADGAAHFHDKPDGEIHLALPIMSRAQLGNMLRKWYEDPYAQTRAGKAQDMAPVDQAVEGTWNSGLTPGPGKPEQPGSGSSGGTVPILGGSFDITAWAMRKAGVGDPYQARKRALLDATRDERAERGGSYRAQQLAKSSEIMRGNLEQLWRSTTDAPTRRETLFQLWDECVEGEGPQAAAGAQARAMVLGWIRAKLPQGGPDAFSAAEIAALDAKRSSKQHFCPYE